MTARATIVIPVYHNEKTIADVVKAVSATLDAHADRVSYDFVLVNDGSMDRSWEVMTRLQQESNFSITLVDLTRNFGQMAALLAGYVHADGDCVVSMSADFQDPPEVVWQLLEPWLAGHKLVVATRAERHDGWLNDTLASLGWAILRRYAMPNLPRGGFDFFVMDREIRDYFIRDPERHVVLQGRLLFHGASPFHVPYIRAPRRDGKSRTTLSRRINFFIDGFVAYSYLPLRVMAFAGVLMFIFAIAASISIVWLALVHSNPVEGWSSLVVLILSISGLQFLAIGVIGEYLWRGLEQVRQRPHYIIGGVLQKKQPKT